MSRTQIAFDSSDLAFQEIICQDPAVTMQQDWFPTTPFEPHAGHPDEGKTAILNVIDQGPGIPVEHQSYVFDRFYRIDQARTREWGGAGLGLSITRWAVEAHGWEITLTSEEGRGTTFRVSLPEAPR